MPLYPFGFAEAHDHQGRKLPSDPAFLTGPSRTRIERAFSDWLTVGGFPEAQGLDVETELIQVCADASDPATSERELRALLAAGEMHPRARKRLLTLTRDGQPAAAPPGVTVQPAYAWMLAGPGAK